MLFPLLFVFHIAMNFTEPRSPEHYRWEQRLLVIFDVPDADFSDFLDKEPGLEERKLLYFRFENRELLASNTSDTIDAASFASLRKSPEVDWVLIGLDGGVKATGKEAPRLVDIFKRIDSMPMRQSEIRRKNKDG